MSARKKKKRPKERPSCQATFHNSVLQAIRQHARSTPQVEICGVLIGNQSGLITMVNGAIAGEGASQGGTHVTFTQETWTRIHEEKDKRYPGQAIVGWYHSHPGFGVFLSDYDVFIQKHFFSDPGSLAWVFDPHSDEEGCFGWEKGKICRLKRFEIVSDGDKKIGTKTEPISELPKSSKHHAWRFSWRGNKYKLFFQILLLLTLLAILFVLLWNGSFGFKEIFEKKTLKNAVSREKIINMQGKVSGDLRYADNDRKLFSGKGGSNEQ